MRPLRVLAARSRALDIRQGPIEALDEGRIVQILNDKPGCGPAEYRFGERRPR